MMILEDGKGNKKTTEKLGFCLYDRVSIPSPHKNVENIEIKGKDGSYTIFHGYNDIEIQANFNAMDDNFKKLFRNFKKALNSTKRISFTEDAGFFYKVKYVDFDTTSNEVEEYGLFNVVFRCEPFIYSYAGSQFVEYANNAVYVNEGYTTYPTIRLTCSSDCEFSINSQNVKIKGATSPVILNCEKMQIYHEATSLLSGMTGEFPKLSEGENIVKIISGINKFEMQTNERWL